MNLLHLIATWAVAVIGTVGLVLLAGWMVLKLIEKVIEMAGWRPVIQEFCMWYVTSKRPKRKAVNVDIPGITDQPNPRRHLD